MPRKLQGKAAGEDFLLSALLVMLETGEPPPHLTLPLALRGKPSTKDLLQDSMLWYKLLYQPTVLVTKGGLLMQHK